MWDYLASVQQSNQKSRIIRKVLIVLTCDSCFTYNVRCLLFVYGVTIHHVSPDLVSQSELNFAIYFPILFLSTWPCMVRLCMNKMLFKCIRV